MQLNLNGKGVIVTGGSRGIGLSIAKGFAAEGANVSICARDPSALKAAEKELGVHGSIVHAQSCDVSDSHALEHYLSAACDALGTLNVLVNNPSGFGRGDDEEGWQKSIDVDLMASVRGSWHAAPQIEKAGGGAIIHVSSISGLTQASRGIRVNAIAPGSIYFQGGLWAQAKQDNRPLYDSILASIPSGRFGMPEEVADLAVFLGSDAGRWVTGQTIAVDGGQML